uniref:Uncharacterized protein n=1 Tax=Solanum tuberosum TaxID=4113 RepID=M1DBW1_SOLTU
MNLMSTYFLGHQSSGLGFATSLSGLGEKRKEERKGENPRFRQERQELEVEFVGGDPYSVNLLGIEGTNDTKCLREKPLEFRGFRDEKRKSKVVKHLGIGVGRRASQCPPKGSLNVHPWGATPASIPETGLRILRVGAPRLSERQGRQFSPFVPHLFVLVPK